MRVNPPVILVLVTVLATASGCLAKRSGANSAALKSAGEPSDAAARFAAENGTFTLTGDTGGTLIISDASTTGFHFVVSVSTHSSHFGELEGDAERNSADSADLWWSDTASSCKLSFATALSEGKVSIKQSGHCPVGMEVNTTGDYFAVGFRPNATGNAANSPTPWKSEKGVYTLSGDTSGTLTISDASPTGFHFVVSVSTRSNHFGDLEGDAERNADDSSDLWWSDGSSSCKLAFATALKQKRISVRQSGHCPVGPEVDATGVYRK